MPTLERRPGRRAQREVERVETRIEAAGWDPLVLAGDVEHVFVTSEGSAHDRFTRAIERRLLRNAEMAARELGSLSPADALALLLLIAEQAPERYERAAARWVAVFLRAAGPMTLADLELTVTSLRLLRSESRSAAGALASVADAYGVASVARVLQRG